MPRPTSPRSSRGAHSTGACWAHTVSMQRQVNGGEPQAIRAPTDLSRAQWIAVLKAAKREASSDDLSSLAAGVAYRIFLSLFPALIAVVAIFRLVADPARLGEYVERARILVPDQAIGIVSTQLSRLLSQDSGAAGSIAIAAVLGGLLAAIAAARAIMTALDRAYGVEAHRGFIRQHLVALVLTLALFLALIGLVVLLVFGPQITEWLLRPVLPHSDLEMLITVARYLAAIVLLVALFGFVYAVGPNRPRPPGRWMSPGAILGVAGWLGASYGFSIYTRVVGSYGSSGPYGAFGGVIVLLVWLQLSMLILLFGAEVNAELERARDQASDFGALAQTGASWTHYAVRTTRPGQDEAAEEGA